MWSSGDAILMRHVCLGRVVQALPVRVVEDDGERLVTWIAGGTECIYPYGVDERGDLLPFQDWLIAPRTWTGHGNLDLLRADEPFAIRHVWAGDGFAHWYVNLQEPYRRTKRGYDSMDHQLDVLLFPDGRAELKDEHHLAQAVATGLFDPAEAAAFDVTAKDVLARRAGLVPTGYESFRPDPDWMPPSLPEGWDRV